MNADMFYEMLAAFRKILWMHDIQTWSKVMEGELWVDLGSMVADMAEKPPIPIDNIDQIFPDLVAPFEEASTKYIGRIPNADRNRAEFAGYKCKNIYGDDFWDLAIAIVNILLRHEILKITREEQK